MLAIEGGAVTHVGDLGGNGLIGATAEALDLGTGEAGGNRVLWIAPEALGFRMSTAHQERAGVSAVAGPGCDQFHKATPFALCYWTMTIPARVPLGMSWGLAALPMG